MGPIGFQEVVVILLLALIFLGPKKLPELASGIGKAIREVRKATADIKQEIELDEIIRKPLEELREATMLPPEELKRRDEDRKWRDRMEKEEKERLAREAENGVNDSAASDGSESYSEYHDPSLDTDPSASVSDLSSSSSSASDPGGLQVPAPDPEAGSLASGASTIGAALSSAAQSTAQSTAPTAATASAETAGGGNDRTIAMNLPPPMAGVASPALPPPRPAPVRRATPPPVPPAAMKSGGDSSGVPTGAVPRVPSGTLIGMLPVSIKPADGPVPPPVDAASAKPAGSAKTSADAVAVGKSSSNVAGKASKKV